jgi:L-cysteate sulfo-lyase
MAFSDIPRIRLAHLPTPLEPLERLTAHFGRPQLWVKRDDCTGLALGGNKTRKLEFLIAEALQQGADTVITSGGIQSNHVRQTAAAAARHGLDCHLVLNRNVPRDNPVYGVSGNIQLDLLLGADIHIHPAGSDRAAEMAALADRLAGSGRRPYVIPLGGSNPLGALGYAVAAREIDEQTRELGFVPDALVHACSSGGTQAGLVAGFASLDSQVPVIGVDIGNEAAEVRSTTTMLTDACARLIGIDAPSLAPRVDVAEGFGGEAYGIPTAEMRAAVELLARTEGLVLDPVYTGKAMAALLDMIASGRFAAGDNVIFLHTGGAPALFAYRDVFEPE